MHARSIEDLSPGIIDHLGNEVVCIYGRRSPVYAAYRTRERVMVMFADREADAPAQRRMFARLHPLRGEINALMDGWRANNTDPDIEIKAAGYDRRVGDALLIGFEGFIDDAEKLLRGVKEDLLAACIRRARRRYWMIAAALTASAVAAIAFITGSTLTPSWGLQLWQAAAGGAVGAFFSLSLALRNRTVPLGSQTGATWLDAALHVTIGMIGAAVLMGFLRSGMVKLNVGGATLGGPGGEVVSVLLAGFVAGFAERLVPDLLDKATVERTPQRSIASAPPAPEMVASAPAPSPASAAAPVTQPLVATVIPPADDAPDDDAVFGGCGCDEELLDAEIMPDNELPAAAGGVADKN